MVGAGLQTCELLFVSHLFKSDFNHLKPFFPGLVGVFVAPDEASKATVEFAFSRDTFKTEEP